MYTPPYFTETDWQTAAQFMSHYNFATLVTSHEGVPQATHLPFVVEQSSPDSLLLSTHLAALNPQSHAIEQHDQLLVIFQAPHAYISPTLYDRRQSVPTWNYVAVHAYGKARLLTNDEQKVALLEKMIRQYEASYQQQWDELSNNYRLGLLKGIVAIEITLTKLEAAYKLSQNKSLVEQNRIAQHLQHSSDPAAQQTGNIMSDRLAHQADIIPQ